MQIDAPGLFFLFSAFQGLVLLIGINIKKPLYSDLKKITSLLLLNIIVITSFYFTYLNSINLSFIHLLGNTAWMSLCPLYFLLIKSLSTYEWSLSYRELRHFIIPAVFMLESILGLMNISIWYLLGISTSQSYLDVWMFSFFSSAIFYTYHSFILVKASVAGDKNLDLKWFTTLFLVTIVLFSALYVALRSRYTITFEITLIGLLGIFIFILIYRVFKILAFQKFFDLNGPNPTHNPSELRTISTSLEAVMEEKKPYLDSQLTLSSLSFISNIKSSDLSLVFNTHYNSSFYDFINRYRVDYLEKLILDDSNSHFKISALAEKSGFRSKATFYKAFKAKHQLTPLQFIKKHRM